MALGIYNKIPIYPIFYLLKRLRRDNLIWTPKVGKMIAQNPENSPKGYYSTYFLGFQVLRLGATIAHGRDVGKIVVWRVRGIETALACF